MSAGSLVAMRQLTNAKTLALLRCSMLCKLNHLNGPLVFLLFGVNFTSVCVQHDTGKGPFNE